MSRMADEFSVFQLSDGRWRAVAQVRDEYGKSRPISKEAKTKDLAQKKMRGFLKRYIPHSPKPGATLNDCCRIYLKRMDDLVSKGARSRKTVTTYRHDFENHIEKTIGHLRIGELKARHVEKCLSEIEGRREGQSGDKAKVNVRAFLRAVINKVAIKDGLVTVNAAELSDHPGYERGEREALTFDNFARVLATETDPIMKGYWILLAETGLRPVEARRLQWTEIYEKEDGSWVRLRASKTKEGKRPRPLSKACIDALPPDNGSLYVFASPKTGKPFNERTLLDRWTNIQTKAECDRVTEPYALRHFYGSQMARTVRDDILKRLMGHTDIRTTKTYYVHVDDKELRAAVDGPKNPQEPHRN